MSTHSTSSAVLLSSSNLDHGPKTFFSHHSLLGMMACLYIEDPSPSSLYVYTTLSNIVHFLCSNTYSNKTIEEKVTDYQLLHDIETRKCAQYVI